jgi:hypothetical protein
MRSWLWVASDVVVEFEIVHPHHRGDNPSCFINKNLNLDAQFLPFMNGHILVGQV